MDESQTPNTETRQPLLSVVMPVFREAAHLPAVLTAVRGSLRPMQFALRTRAC